MIKPEPPEQPRENPTPKDPYPRIIIACIVVTAVLIVPIFMILLMDYVRSAQPQDPPPNPEAFEQMLERPREAFEKDADETESP